MSSWLKKNLPFTKNKKPLPSSAPLSDDDPALVAKRAHPRYGCKKLNHISVKLLNDEFAKVLNISYGGLLLNTSKATLEKYLSSPDQDFAAEICIHQQKLACRLLFSREAPIGIGCSFVHDTEASLQLLKDYLEYFRIGSSLTLDRNFKANENHESMIAYHGYENTKLILTKENDGTISEIKISFYFEQKQRLITVTKEGVVKVEPQNDLKTILTKSIYLLDGFYEQGKEPNIIRAQQFIAATVNNANLIVD